VGILIIVNLSINCNTVYADEKKGFWWYEDPIVQEDAEEDERELGPLPSAKELSKMHPLEIAEELEQRKVYAIWKQTPESVTDYYTVQDVVRRNALAFTALTKFVMLKNPNLSARSAYPSSGAGRNIQTRQRDNMMGQSLSESRDNYALIMFTQPQCPYCVEQMNVLKFFSDRHQWTIDSVDITQRPEVKSRFNVSSTPMTILIERGTENWMPISIGLDSVTAIEDGAYRAVRYLKGDITPKQYFTQEHQDGGFADTVIPDSDT